jgi:two-component system LytT family response regulator
MGNKIRTLIVDDEKPARELIKHYLVAYDDFLVVAEAENGFEALKLIHEKEPDLVFLDIQMPKVSGLELFELLEKPIPDIIFSTAYDQYAVDAFELNAVDYLLKPFDKSRFDSAMKKFIERRGIGKDDRGPDKFVLDSSLFPSTIERIVVKSGYKIHVIPVEEIFFIEAQDDYVMIHTSEGKYLKQQTMKFLENKMPPDKFVRIHRSYIINLDALTRIEVVDKNNSLALLKTGQKLSISKAGMMELRKRLDF